MRLQGGGRGRRWWSDALAFVASEATTAAGDGGAGVAFLSPASPLWARCSPQQKQDRGARSSSITAAGCVFWTMVKDFPEQNPQPATACLWRAAATDRRDRHDGGRAPDIRRPSWKGDDVGLCLGGPLESGEGTPFCSLQRRQHNETREMRAINRRTRATSFRKKERHRLLIYALLARPAVFHLV